jgi:hypothetical protein
MNKCVAYVHLAREVVLRHTSTKATCATFVTCDIMAVGKDKFQRPRSERPK